MTHVAICDARPWAKVCHNCSALLRWVAVHLGECNFQFWGQKFRIIATRRQVDSSSGWFTPNQKKKIDSTYQHPLLWTVSKQVKTTSLFRKTRPYSPPLLTGRSSAVTATAAAAVAAASMSDCSPLPAQRHQPSTIAGSTVENRRRSDSPGRPLLQYRVGREHREKNRVNTHISNESRAD